MEIELNPPEAALVEACGKGVPLLSDRGFPEIRADVIQALCLNLRADWPSPKGVRLKGFRVLGALDFEEGTLTNQLILDGCILEQGINLRFAKARLIDVTGSELGAFAGARVVLTDNLILKDARVRGQIELRQATIGGQIYADGVTVSVSNGEAAIRADGLKVGDDVFLRSANVTGQVRFPGAHVGGNMEFDGATFFNAPATALVLEQADVAGKVFLRANSLVVPPVPFHSSGEVSLLDAKIAGELSCAGALLENPGGRALTCDRARIAGSCFLTQGFRARGEVRFAGARIGSNLEFQQGRLENPQGYGLFAHDLNVEGALMLCQLGAPPAGRINLDHAATAAFYDDPPGWPARGMLEMTGFKYESIGHGSPTDARTRLTWLRLQPAEPFRAQPYEQLATALRNMGHLSDARSILEARQNDLRRYGDLTLSGRAVNLLLGVSVGHGYSPGRIWWLVLASIAVAWSAYAIFFANGVLVPDGGRIEAAPVQFLLLAVGKFLPLVNVGVDNAWRVEANSLGGALLRIFDAVYRGIGWALAGLAAAALTGLIKKD